MCLGAIFWARPAKVFYASTKEDAAAIGFDDSLIYSQIAVAPPQRRIPMLQILREEARIALQEWEKKPDKVQY
jgi:tRNA(Arg) A34 adenosine deaminase TadA